MTGYRVEHEALSAAAHGLDQGAESLLDGTRTLQDTDPHELGTDRLTALTADLLDRSASALARVSADLTDISAGMRQCLAEYTETELHVARLLANDRSSSRPDVT